MQLWLADSLLLSTQAEVDGTAQLVLPTNADMLQLLVKVPGYRVVEETIDLSASHGILAIPMQRGAVKLEKISQEAIAPVMYQSRMSGGAVTTISCVTIVKPAATQRLAQAPKRLFWWIQRRVGNAR
ncbi:hypothetical protein LRS06_16945 [Hymenobacter sp. J193]|uniref:hypothetical protein n=1 Tax=Hymenobacter sp. J193 TaxID=2898429 RepID=UPI0021508E47|nr:hypothetical protein [Hymenobacter sp. J193]MCR5889426.1 hypothetical protein [Hymenobacter sp. J193]